MNESNVCSGLVHGQPWQKTLVAAMCASSPFPKFSELLNVLLFHLILDFLYANKLHILTFTSLSRASKAESLKHVTISGLNFCWSDKENRSIWRGGGT
jgi:hypothetical protein